MPHSVPLSVKAQVPLLYCLGLFGSFDMPVHKIESDVSATRTMLTQLCSHSAAPGVLSRLSPRRDFLNFAFHGEMKTAVTVLCCRHNLAA